MNFTYIVTTFFTCHLTRERGLAAHTIASYSTTMKLLFLFAGKRLGVEVEKLRLEQLDRELILAFLDHLEGSRGNGPSTRNQRLAAIKTFFHFLAESVPALLHLSATVQAIREKAVDRPPPPSLTVPEVEAIIAVPDPVHWLGARDKAMVQVFYNSGARVQELADLEIKDLRCGPDPTVKLTGKGGKTRVIPLWQETLALVEQYLAVRQRAGIVSERLFVNRKGQPLTRFGIGRRIGMLARAAAAACPSLAGRTVTPHVFRHTTALHLIEANNDIGIVKDWLGHADLRTSCAYLEVSLRRKRQALDKLPPPAGAEPAEEPRWKQPKLMEFLSRLSRGVMLPEAGEDPKATACGNA